MGASVLSCCVALPRSLRCGCMAPGAGRVVGIPVFVDAALKLELPGDFDVVDFPFRDDVITHDLEEHSGLRSVGTQYHHIRPRLGVCTMARFSQPLRSLFPTARFSSAALAGSRVSRLLPAVRWARTPAFLRQ